MYMKSTVYSCTQHIALAHFISLAMGGYGQKGRPFRGGYGQKGQTGTRGGRGSKSLDLGGTSFLDGPLYTEPNL